MTRLCVLSVAVLAAGLSWLHTQPVQGHPIAPTQKVIQTDNDSQDDALYDQAPKYFRPTYYCLPSFDGNGILDDGDFSRAVDPGHGDGKQLGNEFAPGWVVAQRT